MASGAFPDLPDWRDAGAYAWLLDTERCGFAWEWLRRDLRYREKALLALERGSESDRGDASAREWGLHRFEDPRQDFLQARPVWAANRYAWVIDASAKAGSGTNAFDLAELAGLSKLVEDGASEHLLLTNGFRSLRLDIAGSVSRGPATLTFTLSGVRQLAQPLLLLARFHSLALTRTFAPALHPPLARAARFIQVLRTADALRTGASQAEIAEVLFSPMLERARWRVHSGSLRLRAQRLARTARNVAAGGFWTLLAE